MFNNLLHRSCRQLEAQLRQEIADLKEQLTRSLSDLNQAHAVFEYTVFDLEKRLADRESELQDCKNKPSFAKASEGRVESLSIKKVARKERKK